MTSISPTGPLEYDEALQRYRSYLVMLAKMQLDQGRRGKLDASDIVQQALLEAHRSRAAFRGNSAPEFMAWLRKILANCLCNAVRDMHRAKRNAARERFEADIDASSMRLERFVTANISTPSQCAQNQEQFLRIADAMTQLPEQQRVAMVLKHCEGWSMSEIGRHLGSTAPSVAGLLKRGMKNLREILDQPRGPA